MSTFLPIELAFLLVPITFAVSYTLVLWYKTKGKTPSGSRFRTRYERLQLEALYGAMYRSR